MPKNLKNYVFALVPASSIVIGFISKKHGLKYKKNLVIGFIMVPLMLIYGSFSFLSKGQTSFDYDAYMKKISSEINYSFPESGEIGVLYSVYDTAYARFTNEYEKSEFVKAIADSDKWVNALKTEVSGYLPIVIQIEAKDNDYYLLYNIDDLRYNSIPEYNGTYRYVLVCYNIEMNKLTVFYGFEITVNN